MFPKSTIFGCVSIFILQFVVFSIGQETFTNPLYDLNSTTDQAISVFQLGSKYYIIQLENQYKELSVLQSSTLTDFRNASKKQLHTSNYQGTGILHRFGNELYLYFNQWAGRYRIHAMKAVDPENPMGEWEEPQEILTDLTSDAADCTVMTHGGRNYIIWRSFVGNRDWSLYIGEMTNATEILEPLVMIKRASAEWECIAHSCSNSAPAVITSRNVSYLVFQANYYTAANTSLTLMRIPFDKDPLDPENWEHQGKPVFERNVEENVYFPGVPSFTLSPDGTEIWMMYTATNNDADGLQNRTARLERIGLDETDGRPAFPNAHGFASPQPVPSGQARI